MLCVTSSGNLTGDLTLSGGSVCNLGIINADITMNSGSIENYATLTATNAIFKQNGGTILNEGDINTNEFNYNGISFVNNGNLTALGALDAIEPGFINNGNMEFTFTGTSFFRDDFTNNGSLIMTGDFVLINGGTFDNNGDMTINGNLDKNRADFNHNSGASLDISGTLTNNRFNILTVSSLITVGVDFTNNGTVNGASSDCGRIDVSGVTTNNSAGVFGVTGSLDLCDASPTGPDPIFDFNSGTVGASVTACVCSIILPIELLYFRATPQNTEVLLRWSTATEINNDFFTVQRSKDAMEWQEALRMPGIGNSETIQVYQSMDPTPLPGRSYYRLKQTDYDGQFSYSEIQSVNRRSIFDAAIFPNPLQDYFYLNFNLEEKSAIKIRLSNLIGQVLYETRLEGKQGFNQFKIDLPILPSGVYHLETYSPYIKVLRAIVE